jgi:hypothetical protein
MKGKTDIVVNVKFTGIDQAIEKVNRLLELLRETQKITDSLSNKNILQP